MPKHVCTHCGKAFRAEPVLKPRCHKLLCGDATVPADVARVMGGRRCKLFSTDPPYLVDYTGADRPNDSGKDWSGTYHEVNIKDAADFFRAVFSTALPHLEEDAAWYCWHAH